MAAHCEDCDGCCRVFEVKEVSKPFGAPCKHLGPTAFGPGCRIYEERPDACRHYVCFWLDGERRGGDFKLPASLRPDRCKVVMGWPWGQDRETMFVYPYPGHPDAWKEDPVKERIQLILSRGGKVLVYVDSNHLIALRGDTAILGTEAEFTDLFNTTARL